MSKWIPTIVKGTRYKNLVEAMEKNGFDKKSGHFGLDHIAIKKPLKEDGTVTYQNDTGNDVAFTLGN